MISYTDSQDHAARTAATRTVITEFARLFYLERDVRRAFEAFVAPGAGRIIEHWDVIQPVPETARNDHPLF